MTQYSYPTINFNETIAGPVNQPTPFRNRIGVIGNFSKGSGESVLITTRKDFAFTYGLDNRLGSLGVQGIFSQNATNLLIKRVISNGTPASFSFLVKGLSEEQQPLVGYGPTGITYLTTIDGEVPLQTSGLTLDAEFIGNPISYSGTGSKISLLRTLEANKPSTKINPLLSLDGIGNIQLINEEYSRKETTLKIDTLSVSGLTGSNIRYVDKVGFTFLDVVVGTNNLTAATIFQTPGTLDLGDDYYFAEGLPVLNVNTANTSFDVLQAGRITLGDLVVKAETLNLTNGTPVNLYVGTKIELKDGVFFVLLENVVAGTASITVKGYVIGNATGYSDSEEHNIYFHLADGVVDLEFSKEIAGTDNDTTFVNTDLTTILAGIPSHAYVERFTASENSYGTLQVIKIKDIEGNIDLLKQIKPGQLIDSVEQNISFTSLNDVGVKRSSLLIMSYPYKESLSDTSFSVLVKGFIAVVAGTPSNQAVNIQVKSNPKAYYLLASKTNISNGTSFSYTPNLVKQEYQAKLAANIAVTAGNYKTITALNVTEKIVEGNIVAILPDGPAYQGLTSKQAILNAAHKTGRVVKCTRTNGVFTTGVITYSELYTKSGSSAVPVALTNYTVYILDVSTYSEFNDIKYIYKGGRLLEQQLDSYIILDADYKADNLVHSIYYKRNDDGSLFEIRSGLLFQVERFLGTESVALVDGMECSLPFGKSSVALGDSKVNGVKLALGLSGLDLLNLLSFEVANNPILNKILDVPAITDDFSTLTYNLKSAIQNESSNNIIVTIDYKSSVENAVPDDILVVDPTYYGSLYNVPTKMVGGLDSASVAKIDLYSSSGIPLYTVVATSPGLAGNEIKITVIPDLNGEFAVLVSDTLGNQIENASYSEILRFSSRSINTDTLELVNTKGQTSRLIRVYSTLARAKGFANLTATELNLVPTRIGPPFSNRIASLSVPINKVSSASKQYNPYYQGAAYLTNLSLLGGDEKYIPTAENDPDVYLNAIKDLENEDVAVVLLPGFDPFKVQNRPILDAIIKQIKDATPYNGLRRYILQIPKGTGTGAVANLANYIDSPWIQLIKGYVSLNSVKGNNNVEGASLVAGLLGTLSPEIPLQSAGAGSILVDVTSVDTIARPAELEAITRAKADVIYFDTGLNVFKLLNGLTTAVSGLDRFTSVRRLSDQVQQDLYSNLLFARSRNNDAKLRAIVSSSVDAYLGSLLTKGKIASFSPTICNSSNNTIQDISERRLNITVRYEVLLPADFVYVNIIREVVNTFSLNI